MMNRETNNGSSDRGAEDVPPPKRRRIALACNACRIRKSRCNGGHPKCSNCIGLGFECSYEASEGTSNLIVRKEQMAVLDNRLQEIEKQLALHAEFLRSHWNACSNGEPIRPFSGNTVVAAMSESATIAQADASEDGDDQPTTDGMGISFVDENDFAFYGPSSNIHFMRAIINAVAPGNPNTPSAMTLTVDSILKASRTHANEARADHEGVQSYILPPEDDMVQMLKAYFGNTGLIFPFIHEATFMHEYNTAKDMGFKKVRKSWLGLLNMIFAMAINIDLSQTPAGGKYPKSNIFYERASKLGHEEMLRGTTIETVQFLLLMSLYLQGAHKSVQTFTIHGLAVKACFSLGLHSSQSSHRFSPVENEIRKRTFYTCVILDRTLSFSFGRPPMIPQDYVRLPLPALWPDAGPQDRSHYSSVFFGCSANLHQISYQTIHHMYGLNIDFVNDESLLITQVLNVGVELDRWRARLPSEMTLLTTEALKIGQVTAMKLPFIMTLRYHNVKLMAYRPFVSRMLQDVAAVDHIGSHTSVQPMIGHVKQPCTDAAKETIDLIETALATPGVGSAVMGAWWFTLHYVFSAALVFAANTVITLNLTVHDGAQQVQMFQNYLNKAIKCLDGIPGEDVILARCRQYIERISQVLVDYGNTPSDQLRNFGLSTSHIVEKDSRTQLATPGSLDISRTIDPFATDANFFNYFPGLDMPDINSLVNADMEIANFFTS
ncbi:fungal-specific transcription factor domain-containing protein [Elsinoe ampelina]|uniref:Fungal-specific transcription factor domain-containing protein n=1 Tax=Elsinoe ampelina TaxID=302913 RepID=A0A6A6G1I3_9PEZI|nr:fungal-specific transcription factor domain-containing protein [Elsinoe ampelina]